LSLSTVLIAANAGLVFLAVVCVALAAVARLERLADRQALARVGLAGSSAVRAVGDAAEDVLTAARLLAERPSITGLLEEDSEDLGRYLGRFQRTGRLAGCAVLTGDRVVVRAGAHLPWPAIARRLGPDREGFLQRLPEGGPLVLGASAPVRTANGTRVFAALFLDQSFERALAEQIGLPVVLLDRDTALARNDDPRAGARARALDAESPVTERLDAEGLYLAVQPLRDPSGSVVGVVETSLARTEIAASLLDLERSLLLLAAVVAAIAVVLSFLMARWLARPLEELKEASERIGGGDLGTPIPHAAGREIGALATTMDDMRGRLLRLTLEQRRRQAEAEAILGGIVEAVFAVDRARRIRYLNPQAAALLGVNAPEALGRFCGDVLNPQGPGGVRPCEENCPIVHARFSGSARATEHLLGPRGDRRTVVITSAAATADAGGPGAASEDGRQFQVMRDETEVEATRRLRDAVLANISHEFRTPLTAQLASIELLRERLQDMDAPEARDLVLSLERGTLRLTQLIDNLLESVRIEAGRHSIRRRSVSLEEVVEEALELTAPLIAQREQDLSVDLPYPLPPVLGDAPRLTQVFVNLLANANKFAPPRSRIGIGGAVGEAEVTVWVEDEGPGISAAAGASIFERFARSPGAEGEADDDEPDQTGMGLGLWIVKSIVERHGGRVEFRHGGNGGTRMCVVLPLEPAREDSRR
jgi:signal transduction histidine kinase